MSRRKERQVSVLAAVLGVVFGVLVMIVLVFGYVPWDEADAAPPEQSRESVNEELLISYYAL